MKKMMKKIHDVVDHLLLHLPETIYIKPIFRKIGVILFFWGGIVNAVVFLFLFLSLWYGFNPLNFETVKGGIR